MLFQQAAGSTPWANARTISGASVSQPFPMPVQDAVDEHWMFDRGMNADLTGRIAGTVLTPVDALLPPTFGGGAITTSAGLAKGLKLPGTDAATQTYMAVLRRDELAENQLLMGAGSNVSGDGGSFVYIAASAGSQRGEIQVNSRGIATASPMQFSRNTVAAVKGSGNTGNGTCGTVGTFNAAVAGVYTVRIGSDPTKFTVTNPAGAVVGTGTVGTLFSGGGLKFTLVGGSTPFVAGDGFDLTTTLPSGKCRYGEYFFLGLSESPTQRILYVGGLGGLAVAGVKTVGTKPFALGSGAYAAAGYAAPVTAAEFLRRTASATSIAEFDRYYAFALARMNASNIPLRDA